MLELQYVFLKVEVVHRQQMQMPLQERSKRTAEDPPKVVYHKMLKIAIFFMVYIRNYLYKKKESSTRRTLHAGVNTRKGANEELFICSISQKYWNCNNLCKNIVKSK